MNDRLRSLDRQRATLRRVILLSAVVGAVLAWGLVGFGYLLVWAIR
jgi:uncharacterized membrane protein YuzA (DUF378 family)